MKFATRGTALPGSAHRTRRSERAAVTERALRHALFVALGAVITLCVARALTDRLHGSPTGEGTSALVLVVLLSAWFIAEVLGAPSTDETPEAESPADREEAKRRTASTRR